MEKNLNKLISIIIPVFNEEENIENCFNKLNQIIGTLHNSYNFEIIFTDNHSTDNSFNIIKKLSDRNKEIKCLRFSKNFGYQQSILAGYLNSGGDAAIQLDCDLQDPPLLIIEFIKKWEEGFQVVYGIRKKLEGSRIINFFRKIFYRVIQLMSNDSLPIDAGDFRLIDRKVIELMRDLKDNNPYLRGFIASVGFNQIGIPYSRSKRSKGVSKFKIKDLFSLAIDGFLNHSIIPLRIATYIGFFVSFLSLALAMIYFFGKIKFGGQWNPGFATTTILIFLSIGINSMFLGIIGEYIGRIFKEVKNTPSIIIQDRLNI